MLTQESLYLIKLHEHYQSGHLYVSGGIADQPALYLDAMRHINQIANEQDDD